MKRSALVLLGFLVASMAIAGVLSVVFGGEPTAEVPPATAEPREEELPPLPGETEEDLAARRRAAHEAMLDRDYPLHGLVTAAQIVVRAQPDSESTTVGWLRLGGRVRLKREPTRAAGCASGWYELYPRGYACAGQGVEVGDAPPEALAAEGAADTSSPLPYRYFVVREPQVPEYHRLPSRNEQRDAIAHRNRYVELLNAGDERRAEQLRQGQLPNEPRMPAVVARYLERGFYVASNQVEVRASRRFVRTVRGSYILEAQLLERTGGDGVGVELGGELTLPIAWAVRAARPLRRRTLGDGSERFVEDDAMEAWERQARVPWLRRERRGAESYHVLEGPDDEPRYLRAWFVSVAERRDPPRGVRADEPWVHVDLSEQTLVVYRGTEPVYATLVSSGLDGHDTPVGEFTIRRKFVSDTMANLGPEAGDDSYRIEDVPWTQYFDGSVALHGAFWHGRFGLRRSHGCVNLSPRDARYVYEHTWPEVPEGWHGVSTERSGFQGSRVVVTE
jgi:hypothetical protein